MSLVNFFLKKSLTRPRELVKILTSSEDKTHFWEFREVIKMMEFLLTMTVIALVFVAATIVVALFAGGLVKLRHVAQRRNTENASPE